MDAKLNAELGAIAASRTSRMDRWEAMQQGHDHPEVADVPDGAFPLASLTAWSSGEATVWALPGAPTQETLQLLADHVAVLLAELEETDDADSNRSDSDSRGVPASDG